MDLQKAIGGVGLIIQLVFMLVVGLLFTLMLAFGEPTEPREV